MTTNRRKQSLKNRSSSTTHAKLKDYPSLKPSNSGFRTITISLYTPEFDWVAYITKTLQRAGYLKANRSLVIREAILRFKEEIEEKTPADILIDFIEHQAKRNNRSYREQTQ